MTKKNNSVPKKLEELIRPEIRALNAYHVPDSKGFVKSDAMENPYVWPEELKQSWLRTLANVEINRYPDPGASEVIQGFRHRMGVADEYDILLGNGSDELIQLIAMAVSKPGRVIMAPEPGFVMYKMIATFTGMDYVGVPLNEDFSLNLELMLENIRKHQPEVIFLAQPNNPTGNVFPLKDIEAIIQAAPGIVVIDEAYTAFTEANFLYQLDHFDNVLIMRTVSKMGLAGLRLGLLIAHPAWIAELNKIRLPYNINVLTQATARFALEHYETLSDQAELIKSNRAELFRELSQLESLTVWPSEANFILVRSEQKPARAVFEELKDAGILIKCLDGSHPALKNCLRFTVGTKEENQLLVKALKNLL